MLGHHAYLCRVEEVKPESVQVYVKKLNIEDVNYVTIDSFGIGDVRTLTEKAFIRPSIGSKQLIVVCISSITIEAQQALLKILEEPPASTVFIFCIPKGLFLLPTLLSRFHEEKTHSLLRGNKINQVAVDFFGLNIVDRLAEISNRLLKKDLVWVDDIKSGLLTMLVNDSKKVSPKNLASLFWIAEHLQTRGASNKLLLEELALTLG